jgi:hypothetical protein
MHGSLIADTLNGTGSSVFEPWFHQGALGQSRRACPELVEGDG